MSSQPEKPRILPPVEPFEIVTAEFEEATPEQVMDAIFAGAKQPEPKRRKPVETLNVS